MIRSHSPSTASDVKNVPISVFIPTYNEEENLEACLQSLLPWAGEVLIVDSCSTDRTLEIAERHGVKVFQNPFTGHGAQRNWALEHLPFRFEWVMGLDADHRVTPELRDELAELIPRAPAHVLGYYVKRRQIFRGKWIRHGGYYPKYMLKLFRRGAARCDEQESDHRFYVSGPTAKLWHDIIEDNRKEAAIHFFIEKHNQFAGVQALEESKFRRGERVFLTVPRFWGTPDQRVLWLKQRWYRLPLYLRPFLYFFYRFIGRLGFLDGKEGFLFHFLQGFWFRLLVDIKLEEIERQRIGV